MELAPRVVDLGEDGDEDRRARRGEDGGTFAPELGFFPRDGEEREDRAREEGHGGDADADLLGEHIPVVVEEEDDPRRRHDAPHDGENQ